jgi:hypothetical protein
MKINGFEGGKWSFVWWLREREICEAKGVEIVEFKRVF